MTMCGSYGNGYGNKFYNTWKYAYESRKLSTVTNWIFPHLVRSWNERECAGTHKYGLFLRSVSPHTWGTWGWVSAPAASRTVGWNSRFFKIRYWIPVESFFLHFTWDFWPLLLYYIGIVNSNSKRYITMCILRWS